jgi:hypothetical protein
LVQFPPVEISVLSTGHQLSRALRPTFVPTTYHSFGIGPQICTGTHRCRLPRYSRSRSPVAPLSSICDLAARPLPVRAHYLRSLCEAVLFGLRRVDRPRRTLHDGMMAGALRAPQTGPDSIAPSMERFPLPKPATKY